MKHFIGLIIFFITVATYAESTQNIVAIVNDDPITFYEFDSRKRMLMKLNNIQHPDSNTIKELNNYALQTLIDESILEQHAAKVGGRVLEDDIQGAIATIEKRNNMPSGYLVKSFGDKAIEKSFKSQIRAELIKINILSYLSKSITISPKEVDVAILAANTKDTRLIAKIYTSKDKDEKTFNKMNILRKQFKNCDSVKKSAYEKFADVTDIEENISSLSPQLRTIANDLNVNQASRVFETSDGFKVVVVCKKEFHDVSQEENTYITNFLTNKKMSQKAQKFFDSLRKKAYIKIINP